MMLLPILCQIPFDEYSDGFNISKFTIKSNERSEDSYIGLADFFCFFLSGKVLKY